VTASSKLLVQKYGGSSVGSVERIAAVVARIARDRAAGRDVVAVVSAMGDTTDDLLALASSVTGGALPNAREQDALLATGEIQSAALLAMALIALVAHPKLQSYLEVALLAVTLGLYLTLRKAVRHISDAPNELLDERQIAARDAAYTVAYRGLAFVGVAAFFLHTLLPFGGEADDLFAGRGSLILAFVMAAAALPAMVLAWNLPSEQPEA
jgi:hypothetical protein